MERERNPKDYIPVSEIARCSLCPMQLYLERTGKEPYREPLRYSSAKQISYHLGEELDADVICREVKTVTGEPEECIRPLVDEMIAACTRKKWRPAEQYDVSVLSQTLGITGRIDRMFSDGFSLIKSGAAPTHGIYAADRIRITAYTLCLEEAGVKNPSGSVEYLGSGTIRNMVPGPADRRAFLHALRVAERIRAGEIPREIRGTHCLRCRHKESCQKRDMPKTLLEQMKDRLSLPKTR